MRLISMLFIYCLFLSNALAQDERWIRKIFENDTQSVNEKLKKSFVEEKDSWKVKTPRYAIDLNQDKKKEFIQVKKINLKDYLYLYDHNKKHIRRFPLDTMGVDSYLYKIHIKHLSAKKLAIIVHYYEGYIEYLDFNARSRLYLIVIEDNNLDKMYFSQGPSIWHEQKLDDQHYHRRAYFVDVVDLNKDGIRDLSVKYGKISRVGFYQGEGVWDFL